MSRPTRGAWIEIRIKDKQTELDRSRAPHGARGLKLVGSVVGETDRGSRPTRGVQRILVRHLERTKYGPRRAGGKLHLVKDA